MKTFAGWLNRLAACFLLAPALAAAANEVLTHDTGRKDGMQSMAGTGHVIEFTAPRGTWYIASVEVYGSRYGGGYDPEETLLNVAVCDEGLDEIASVQHPYSLFAPGRFDWIDLPMEVAIQAPPVFKVAVSFDPTATKGVFVGWSQVEQSHSSIGLPGNPGRAYEPDKEWMIRVNLAKKKPRGAREADFQLLQHDTGRKDGQQSLGGSGHVVTFRRPSGTWYLRSVKIYGTPYGGDYDPESPFTVSVCDSRGRLISEAEDMYRRFPLGRYAWIEVPLEEAVKPPSTFKVIVSFQPTATRGIFVGFSEVDNSHSSVGLPGEKDRPFDKDKDWMIRAVLTREKPDLARAEKKGDRSAEKTGSRPAGVYQKDFDFLERTVKSRFPALKKKGVDWKKVCAEWEKAFRECRDDRTHLLNVRRMLAVLGDMHTGITRSSIEVHVPSFDGLYGSGLWIAEDRGRLVLRALMSGHDLASRIRPGAELLLIDGRPAQVVHEEVRRRLREWSGWSSTHFLDARLSFQFFPFGEKDLLQAAFLNPDGSLEEVRLSRWGPGGRGLSRQGVTLPEGVEGNGPAVSKKLNSKVGYIRILGGMSDDTRQAFDRAFDALKGVDGMLLDCRGMGGGGDGPAWAMAGRFYSKRTPLGTSGNLEPAGEWQFDGPVVMLQDEREVSSAETFTWAMTETGRAVSVGRSTGGGTIIPRTFDAPSGLFSFRMGCHDRATPIRGVQPEGTGTPPDVFVPYEPALLERHGDPVFAVGRDLLLMLMEGAPGDRVVDCYGGLLGADPDRFKRSFKSLEKAEGPDRRLGFLHVTEGIVEPMVEWEIRRCNSRHHPMPGFKAAAERLAALAEIAALLDLDRTAEKARAAAGSWKEEVEAEEAYRAMVEASFPPEEKALERFLERHGDSRYGRAAAGAWPGSRGGR